MTERVSVIVVTHDDKEKLLDCLSSLEGQSYPEGEKEIIVVDDGSTDGSSEAVREVFPEVRIIEKEQTGPDSSRNAGVALARGSVLMFVDSDCVVAPDWMTNALQVMRENQATIIAGRVIHQDGFLVKLVGLSDFGEFQSIHRKKVSNVPTCAMIVRRSVFRDVSFDSRLAIGGDTVFCHKLKKKGVDLLYDPRIEVEHRPRVDWVSFLGRAYRYGEGFVRTRLLFPDLPYGSSLRFGCLGVVSITLARVLLDWKRLAIHWRTMDFKHYELPLASMGLALKRLVSVFGAIDAYWHGKDEKR